MRPNSLLWRRKETQSLLSRQGSQPCKKSFPELEEEEEEEEEETAAAVQIRLLRLSRPSTFLLPHQFSPL